MAAGPSQKRIRDVRRRGLQKLQSQLLKKGIKSRYEAGLPDRAAYLSIEGCNAYTAGYRLLRASNGECALYPYINVRESSRENYEGWDAFDKIELQSIANGQHAFEVAMGMHGYAGSAAEKEDRKAK
jgi:hypothetical protein